MVVPRARRLLATSRVLLGASLSMLFGMLSLAVVDLLIMICCLRVELLIGLALGIRCILALALNWRISVVMVPRVVLCLSLAILGVIVISYVAGFVARNLLSEAGTVAGVLMRI